jgi:hypothetical protein
MQGGMIRIARMHGLYARMRCACCPLPDHISRIEAARDSGRGGAEAEECKDWGARREGLLQERQRTHSDTALEARRRSSRHEGQVQGSSALTQSSRYKAPQHGDKAHRHKGRVQGSSALRQSSRYKAPQHGDEAHRHKGRVQGSSARAQRPTSTARSRHEGLRKRS